MSLDDGHIERSGASTADRGATTTTTYLGGGLLLAVAVVLAALNLRPPVTAVGSVLDEMRGNLNASGAWAGALTTAPGLCFAVAGLATPLLARRIGVNRSVTVALVLLTGGLVLRVLDGPLVVLGGTLVACAGIALANVLIPVVIKASFAVRVGLMTGIYTAALQAGGALGSSVTPPLDAAFGGWRVGLASWAVLAALALGLWLSATRGGRRGDGTLSGLGGGRSLLRNWLAWIVTAFFGFQACLAYTVMGWWPQVLMDAGVSRSVAGLLLGLISLIGLPVSLVVPPIAASQRSGQSWWIVGLGAFGTAGITGMMVAPSASPLLWSIFVGIGMSVFSLAITTITLRARTSRDASALSGMAQGFGYLLAAAGPFLFGFLRESTGGWTAPFVLLLCVVLGQVAFGFLAGRPRYV